MGRYLDLAKAAQIAKFCGNEAATLSQVDSAPSSPFRSLEGIGTSSFESDRGCEKSELCEKRFGTEGYEKNEKSRVRGTPVCPPGGRAVLLQPPDGVPAGWSQGVANLLAMPPNRAWPEAVWKVLKQDALAFLNHWAAQAHSLGWNALDLFGVHGEAPRARLDGMGLVPMLGGRPVVAITDSSAAITDSSAAIPAASGGSLTYRRRKVWAPGCCLIWELEGLS